MSRPSVAISLLAFRSLDTVERALQSCLKLEYDGPLELIVREQGGDDREAAAIGGVLEAPTRPGLRTRFERGPNLGFAAGHNRAIKRSGAEFVLLLNADAELDPAFLSHALEPFGDDRVASVQGKLLRFPEGEPADCLDSTGLQPFVDRSVVNRGQGQPDDGAFDEPAAVFGADGAAPVYRRAALEDAAVPVSAFRAGGSGVEYFDESFFAYKEDVDLAWRLQWRRWASRYQPSAIAWHGRTGRMSTGLSLASAVRERRAVPSDVVRLGFANQRLMQVKCEDARQLAAAWRPWLRRELATWAFGSLSPATQASATARLARLLPMATRKRRWIQAHRAAGADPYAWFAAPRRPAASR